MTGLRILHVSPTYYASESVVGGGEKYVMYMAEALALGGAELGVPVSNRLLAFGEKPGTYALPWEVIAGRPWEPQGLDVATLRARLAEADVIIVHQCLSAVGLLVAAQAQLLGKFVVGMNHGSGAHPVVAQTPTIGHLFDFFQAYSQFATAAFQDLEGAVEIVPGPVDAGFFQPDPASVRDHRLVVALGRMMPHKGFDRIVRALPQALRLIIIGSAHDPAYARYLKQLARQRAADVTLLSDMTDEQVRTWLQTAGLFVHASTHLDYRGQYHAMPELLGLAPLEALCCGTPTLVSTAGSLPELAVAAGCRVFETDEVLATWLSDHAAGKLDMPPSAHISRDVAAKFGAKVFGTAFMRTLLARM